MARTRGHRVFAALYDPLTAAAERGVIGDERRALLQGLTGAVLEIGGGTGANLEAYPEGLDRLVVTEPDPFMRRRLRVRAARTMPSAEVVDAVAEHLPFADGSFDVAVSTVVLCSVDQPDAAVRELARVLRAGGRLLFAEHVRSDRPSVARWQDRLTPLQRRLAGGCHLNRPTLAVLREGGFAVEQVRTLRLPSPAAALLPFVTGAARRA